MSAGLGHAGLGAVGVAEAQPAPFTDYHWCPGQLWDPAWGNNWDGGRCHDDHWRDGEARDRAHRHSYETATDTDRRSHGNDPKGLSNSETETAPVEITPRWPPSEDAIVRAAITVILVALVAIFALAAGAILTMG
jgi:hypothetical protein